MTDYVFNELKTYLDFLQEYSIAGLRKVDVYQVTARFLRIHSMKSSIENPEKMYGCINTHKTFELVRWIEVIIFCYHAHELTVVYTDAIRKR